MPRLTELMARNLGISKTAVARLMDEGRVTDVDGAADFDRKTMVPAGDLDHPWATVLVDGAPLSLWHTAIVLQHKPTGVVTALRDPIHPTAYDLLRDAPLFPELRAVGRLDLDSSGLLLWTTDGPLIQRLTHPKRRVPRTYQAALAGPFRAPDGDLVLDDGHRPEIVDLRTLSTADVHPALALTSQATTLATITIIGGAYHEVRRVFAALGSHVVALARTEFGPYRLPADLPAGGWLRVSPPATARTRRSGEDARRAM